MRRRRQQKLEKKLQQFRSKDGGPDTGGTLKIYGEALCKDVPYKTLLLSVHDSAAFVVEEMLDKYGIDKKEAHLFCLVQSSTMPPQPSQNMPKGSDNDGTPISREYYLEDDECPLAILMNHSMNPARGNISNNVRGLWSRLIFHFFARCTSFAITSNAHIISFSLRFNNISCTKATNRCIYEKT
jgi:afadin